MIFTSKYENDIRGDVFGLELEFEGKGGLVYRDLEDCCDSFVVTEDGSLRGDWNAEFVLRKPMPLISTIKATEKLYKNLRKVVEEDDGGLIDSPRAGVHVHLNFNGKEARDIISFICLWYTFEELLSNVAGVGRKGSLFALRAVDTPYQIDYLTSKVRSGTHFDEVLAGMYPEDFKYSGLNLCNLWSRGSIEIRHLRTPMSPLPLVKWLRFINKVYKYSSSTSRCRDILAEVSKNGATSFLNSVFGRHSEFLIKASPNTSVEATILRGMRMVQPFMYACNNWDNYLSVVGKKPIHEEDEPNV